MTRTWRFSELTLMSGKNMGLQTKSSVGTVNVSPRNRFLERNLADARTAACIASGRIRLLHLDAVDTERLNLVYVIDSNISIYIPGEDEVYEQSEIIRSDGETIV